MIYVRKVLLGMKLREMIKSMGTKGLTVVAFDTQFVWCHDVFKQDSCSCNLCFAKKYTVYRWNKPVHQLFVILVLPDNKHEDGNCTGTHVIRKQSSENPFDDPFLKQAILFLIAGEISPFILFVFALAYKPMSTLQRFHVTFYNSIFTLSLWVAVCLNQKKVFGWKSMVREI